LNHRRSGKTLVDLILEHHDQIDHLMAL